jgi:hypothetical protein
VIRKFFFYRIGSRHSPPNWDPMVASSDKGYDLPKIHVGGRSSPALQLSPSNSLVCDLLPALKLAMDTITPKFDKIFKSCSSPHFTVGMQEQRAAETIYKSNLDGGREVTEQVLQSPSWGKVFLELGLGWVADLATQALLPIHL